ncbi:MAG: Sec-independent protein translocase subunit TatA [Humibacillus sp.]|nr:Sec-independent protein translocase subunit TatA [Humibacillus sp.]MDN5777885.1 Sec-independent protein translocase subunit TatA [Humibacillus sp.]
MLRNLSPAHVMIVVVVLVVLFGWKRLPDMARSLGRSARVFKSEVEEMKKDGKGSSEASGSTVPGDVVDPMTGPTEQERLAAEARVAADARVAEAEAQAAQARAEAERLRGGSTR